GRDGQLWAGTGAGLYRFDHEKLVWSAGKDRLAFPDVRAITEGADGAIWFGMSGGGLGCLRGETLYQFRKRDGVGSDFIISLYADPDGTLWAGSSDNGLTVLNHGKFGTITTKNG